MTTSPMDQRYPAPVKMLESDAIVATKYNVDIIILSFWKRLLRYTIGP
jgi:hypothetical protein